MALWHKVRRELAGAWRSARYDVTRHRRRRLMVRLAGAETAEFGPRGHRGLHVAKRPPRRIAAGAGVALLVAGGAAGTYLAVAGSLTALRPGPAQPPAAQPAAPAPATATVPVPRTNPLPNPTQPRPQVRRTTPKQVIALPPIGQPQPVPTTNEPESTLTPSPSPSESSPSPSPSVRDVSPSSSASKHPKWGQQGDEGAASGQSGAGR
ncbi:hypothetical protein ACFFX1_48760 [Dactylosporangium sucinum]|uniref:Uncharacterized protein n=1 Tax=Dactylosporangium sucinum TaxID=1424081 RepID=A0A917UC99_9ACTN|nr:hypothetical protein [Dactylosporangium sucinum]GGM80615.1 hypothetical protein GCM10007977_097620 [Dactylosporangium sucinum]